MKYKLDDLKDTKMRCAHCKNTEELIPELTPLVKCKSCKLDHYIEVYICKCGEHYYLYQTQELLQKRKK